METLKTVNLVLLILLSITAGMVMQMPEDMKFFQDAGFSGTLIILFGVAHLTGGILLVFPEMRKLGTIIIVVTFCILTIIIFISGKIAFGFFSILLILMAGIVFFS